MIFIKAEERTSWMQKGNQLGKPEEAYGERTDENKG